ncbi:carbohydrate ABC transporter permease [Deinococcus roseus]|uniref:Sugar ABC transporter permease n=1 Tax=Deinococcus roseus TaxID=392414 RepID=A0ABQ2CVI5_9DEIO|nr:sugar ABC transporter permease [Deinococcus roseus]GGJ24998.1 sugar ABC transporter permease [Deinococcus roseus]
MQNKTRTALIAYAFLAPALILLAVFTFYPVIYGSYLGFTEYKAAQFAAGEAPRFIGIQNFITLFQDELFITGLWNSVKYIAIVPALQVAALAIAVAVNRKLPFMGFFRAAYYIPVITSIATAAVMWDWVFQKEGILNWVLQSLHFINSNSAFGWLNNEYTAIWALMLVTFWRGFGFYMVLYMGGLQAVPAEVEEAANLDGATPFQTFWLVIVPMMRPTLLLCSLLSTFAAIRVLDEPLTFTPGGGPLNSTYTALMYVYQKAFNGFNFDYGVASAAGLIIAVVGIGLSIVQFRLNREGEERA